MRYFSQRLPSFPARPSTAAPRRASLSGLPAMWSSSPPPPQGPRGPHALHLPTLGASGRRCFQSLHDRRTGDVCSRKRCVFARVKRAHGRGARSPARAEAAPRPGHPGSACTPRAGRSERQLRPRRRVWGAGPRADTLVTTGLGLPRAAASASPARPRWPGAPRRSPGRVPALSPAPRGGRASGWRPRRGVPRPALHLSSPHRRGAPSRPPEATLAGPAPPQGEAGPPGTTRAGPQGRRAGPPRTVSHGHSGPPCLQP